MFQHTQLNAIMTRQLLQNPFKLSTGGSEVLTSILDKCPFLFSYQTKQLYLKLVSTTSVDIYKTIENMKAYFKKNKKLPENPYIHDLINGEQKKRKVAPEEIDRENLLESSCKVMDRLSHETL